MAYDFSAVCSTGQTLYYNITSDVEPYTVEVTSENGSYPYYTTYPTATGELVIPESVEYENFIYSVTIIGDYAFEDCSGLTSLTIPNSVTSIGYGAFSHCTGLTSVTIPNSVISIGDNAFYNCSGFTEPVYNANCFAYFPSGYATEYAIPDGIQQIVGGAFYYCSGLTFVTIPNSVISIGSDAFGWCSGLTKVNYTGTIAQWCGITFGNGTANPLFYGHNLYINNSLVTDLVIPNTVAEIKNIAFYGATCLTSVTIPNSVTSIGDYAFGGCSGIAEPLYNANCFAYFPSGYATEYAIPDGIQQIVGGAFSLCSELTSVTIPNSVTSIGGGAFYSCSGLTSITIPESVTSIGETAFCNCSGLTTVNFNATNCTYMGSLAFYVYGRNSLTTLNIGNSVELIPDSAFYSCNSITSIYSYAENPPAIQLHTFESSISDIPVFVKCGDAEDYRSAENWSNFTNIQGSKYMLYVESDNSQMGTAAVTQAPDCTDGTAIIKATPQNGYRFIRWNDGNTDNPHTVVVTNNTTFIASFEVGNGIVENSIESKISLYPNPVGNTLCISSEVTISEIEIVNVMGQVVRRIEVNSDNVTSDVEDLKAGVYIVRIHGTNTESVVCQRKFIKE